METYPEDNLDQLIKLLEEEEVLDSILGDIDDQHLYLQSATNVQIVEVSCDI